MTVKMPEPEVSLYVQCANGMQIPVRSFSEVQMQAYAQARVDEVLDLMADKASQKYLMPEFAKAIRTLKEGS